MTVEYQVLNAVRDVARTVDGIASAQNVLDRRVQEVSQTQSQTQHQLLELQLKVEDFIQEARRAATMDAARSELIQLKQDLEQKYGHYDQIRRLVSGILQAMDTGIVTQETMREAVEGKMISTPRYWLAPALVALAAWIRDDRELALKSLAEAVRRDTDKTSLFFALVLTRHRRYGATASWVNQYVARQDPSRLSRDFTVILDAVTTGALGAQARPLVLAEISGWYHVLTTDTEVVAAQAQRWKQLIEGLATAIGQRFIVLPQICADWSRHRRWLEVATVFGEGERLFRGRLDPPLAHSPDLRQRVDAILDALVKNHDPEEIPLRKEEAKHRAVLAHHGDEQAAAEAVAAEAEAHETQVDLLTLLTNAAFYREAAGATEGTERMAIALCRDWIITASQDIEKTNRTFRPATVKVKVEGWNADLGVLPETALAAGLSQHIDTETENKVSQVKLAGSAVAALAIGAITGAIGLLGAIGAAASGSSVACFVFLLIVAFGLGIYGLVEHNKLPVRRDAIRKQGEERKRGAVRTLKGAVAETIDLYQMWADNIALSQSFHDYLAGLRPESFTLAAPELGREILVGPNKAPHAPLPAAAMDEPETDSAGRVLAIQLPAWDLMPPTEFVKRVPAA